MSSSELSRIAFELECIREILERALPPQALPVPPEKKFGKEAISYIDEETIVELEEEELRQTLRGVIPALEE